jgi:outer membrane protein assembly factor BamD
MSISVTSRTSSSASPNSRWGTRVASHLATVAVIAATMSAVPACRHTGEADIATLTAGSDEVLWQAASRDLAKKRFETARRYLNRIIEGFPNSQHQPEARLLLADSYFNEGGPANLILAATHYREFGNIYPSHPQADYAQFQVAECHFKQRLSPDRDQTNTEKALEEFLRFVELHPASARLEQGQARITQCRWALARADHLVGYFYQRTRRYYRAAIQRYESLLTSYPDYAQTDEVLYRLSECLVLSGRAPEALPHLAKLLETYPSSRWVTEAQALKARAELPAAPAVTPPPTQAPAPPPTPPAETRPGG